MLMLMLVTYWCDTMGLWPFGLSIGASVSVINIDQFGLFTYLVDDDGNYLIDDDGNYFITD